MNLEEPILTEWEAKMLDEIEKYDTIKNSKEEGETKKQKEIAKKILKDNMDIDLIVKYTSLSKEEIIKLSKK